MKPTFQTNDNGTRKFSRKFPVTDFDYHSIALEGYRGSCVRTGNPSFHTLSRDYFKTEAQQYFLAEAIVFGAIMLTAALPIVNGIRAVLDLVRAGGGI
jgi:hypothetical protein